jgi:hypothetical protein
MADATLDAQVEELLALLIAHVGYPEELYPLVYDGVTVLDQGEVEDDEDPLWRVLCPPTTEEAASEAEKNLGFPLPPLLRSVYTRIGNGGLALRLLGLEGGQTGGDVFPGRSAVEIYQELERWRRAGKVPYRPERLLPVNDDLGCGMVDYVDCRTPEGKIWRTDSGRLLERQPTLLAYLREAIEGYRSWVKESG